MDMAAGHIPSSTVMWAVPMPEGDLSPSESLDPGEEFEEQNLEIQLDMDTLEKLYHAVKCRDQDREIPLTPRVFIRILEENTNIQPEEAELMFKKIDWSSLHRVSWREFCTFLQMEFKVKEQRARKRNEVEFWLPALTSTLPHRDNAVSVMTLSDGLWVTTSIEATITLWDNYARLKRYKLCLSAQRMKKKVQKQWVTDSVLMPEFSKIILTTGNREIQFYDMASFSPFCQISGLESIPITICYRGLSRGQCLITYGDQMGCISVLIFYCMHKSFRLWKKLHKHENFIPSIPIEQAVTEGHVSFTRWQVHKDWVSMARYYIETDQIASCSRDPKASLVIGSRRGSTNVVKMRREEFGKNKRMVMMGQTLYGSTKPRVPQDQIVFTLTRGIAVFDFSPKMKIVATGGADRVIRLWNAFLPKSSVGNLCGHYDVIRFLHLCHNTKRLYSASADRWVKVWDVRDHTCLLTVPWHAHHVTGELHSVCFSHSTSSLALLGDNIGILKLREENPRMTESHKQAVNCILYNPVFNHIISASADSTVRTWDLNTGHMVVEFVEAHDTSGITCMTMDTTMKRLITFATDGTGKMWNHHTGQCRREFQPANKDVEITCVVYVDMRNVKYVMTGGWSHRINRYIDDTPQTIPFELPLQSHWRDDLLKGHKADILCCDFSQRDRVATGDDQGVVIVWNVETGYRAHVLVPPKPQDWSQAKLKADPSISCVYFLKHRSKLRRGGNLVVGGPYGHVSIWNTNFMREVSALAHYPVNPSEDEEVVRVAAIASDEENMILVTGDSSGYVCVWNLEAYALHERQEQQPPPRLYSWLAHAQRLTSILVVKSRRFVVTASSDHTVRLWTLQGVYVGTFGQSQMWSLDNTMTYKRNSLPSELCFDRPTGEETKSKQENAEDIPEELLTVRSVDHYQPGLSYFARKKAVLSKKGRPTTLLVSVFRHLNDEILNPFSSVGTTAPYQSLRHYDLQEPPTLPDKASMLGRQLAQDIP